MITDMETIDQEVRKQFASAGLLPFLVEDASEVVDRGGEVFAEIVVSDRAKLEEATGLMSALLQGKKYSLVVRSKWVIENIGDLAPAYGPSGGLRAAVLVPVTLQSGAESVLVTVAITKLAEQEFDFILGRKTDLRQVAKVVVESALRKGGSNFWDPTVDNYLEVASGSAANISRLLKQTA